MNKNYETVFIVNPVLSEKQVEDTVKKYKKILDKNKIKTICDESLGFKNSHIQSIIKILVFFTYFNMKLKK